MSSVKVNLILMEGRVCITLILFENERNFCFPGHVVIYEDWIWWRRSPRPATPTDYVHQECTHDRSASAEQNPKPSSAPKKDLRRHGASDGEAARNWQGPALVWVLRSSLPVNECTRESCADPHGRRTIRLSCNGLHEDVQVEELAVLSHVKQTPDWHDSLAETSGRNAAAERRASRQSQTRRVWVS